MASEWPQVPLLEVADILTGFPFKGEAYLPPQSGIRVVRGDNVTEGSIRWGEKEKCWPSVTADLKPYVLKAKDLVIGMDGSKVGKNFATISVEDEGALLAQRVARLRAKGPIQQSFLKYSVCNSAFTNYVKSIHTGTSIPHISKSQIQGFEVYLPPYDEQTAIADALGALDNRIDHNRALAANLEAIARRLFKSWFVDFDPVRAKAAGEKPAGLADDIAALFPDRFVESGIGDVPEGWAIKPVGDLAEIVGGSTPSTKNDEYWIEGQYNWATPKDLAGLSSPVLLSTERKVTDAGLRQISSGLLPLGTVLLSSRAPIGYLAISTMPVAINQGFIAMKPNPGVSNLFLLYWAAAAHESILANANGSTFLEISKKNFRPIPVVVPSVDVMSAFSKSVLPLFERIVCAEREIQALGQIRDLLLPRLISGKLRIEDAETMIQEAIA